MDLFFPLNDPFSLDMTSYSVTVSFRGFSQSKMTNEGQPSTVTTVRLVGGFCGGLVAFPSVASSVGKRLTESVMEQGLLSGFGIYRTWGPTNLGFPRGSVSLVGLELKSVVLPNSSSEAGAVGCFFSSPGLSVAVPVGLSVAFRGGEVAPLEEMIPALPGFPVTLFGGKGFLCGGTGLGDVCL